MQTFTLHYIIALDYLSSDLNHENNFNKSVNVLNSKRSYLFILCAMLESSSSAIIWRWAYNSNRCESMFHPFICSFVCLLIYLLANKFKEWNEFTEETFEWAETWRTLKFTQNFMLELLTLRNVCRFLNSFNKLVVELCWLYWLSQI